MPLVVYDTDYSAADDLLSRTGLPLLRSAIAHAIAEERERCASIADVHAKSECTGTGSETAAMRLGAQSIAAAIRAGNSQ